MARAIVLASASPRRRQLLEAACFEVTVRSATVDEAWPGGDPGEGAIQIAERKLDEVYDGDLTVAGDTVVWLDGTPLGKPRDMAEARATLRRLSGQSHQVITGFVVAKGDRRHQQAVVSEVAFRNLSDQEIDRYVATGEPMDKAGAYGIQGQGGALVGDVRGSYNNVVGLPLAAVIAAVEGLQ